MLIKYTPSKNPLGKPQIYSMGKVRFVEGVNKAPDTVKDHPSFELMLKTGAFEVVEATPPPAPTVEEKPKGRKPKDPESLRIV